MSMSRSIIVAALLVSAGFFAQPLLAAPVEFRGELQRGDRLVHLFEYAGRKFEFRLAPLGQGWSIWIGDPLYRERNHVVTTPPYGGINDSVIQGWHFRNADNTGPNEHGEGDIDAPGRTRRFALVLDAADYREAREALDILMRPDGRDKAEIEAAQARLESVPMVDAVMEIEALELGNLVEGEQAWIDRLAFRVRIDLP